MRSRLIIWWLATSVFLIAFIAIGIWFWLDWHNTIAASYDKTWDVSKRNLSSGVMGTDNFYSGRQALAGGKLNLGAWHGFQEVIENKLLDYSSLKINFDIEQHGYVYFLFNCQKEFCDALRLSNNNNFPSAMVRILPSGGFTSNQSLPTANLKLENNELVIRISPDKNHLSVTLNNFYLYDFQLPDLLEEKRIGFRGGYLPIKINSLEAINWQGNIIFAESFDNQQDWYKLFIQGSILGLILFSLILSLSVSVFKIEPQLVIKNCFLGIFSATLVLFSLILVDKYFAPRYPKISSWFSSLDKQEAVYVGNAALTTAQELSDKYSFDPTPGVFRVMFLGTSQSAGAGAAQTKDIITTQLENKINLELGTKTRKYEVLRAGVSGAISKELVSSYETQWYKFKPKLMLVNLSTNDDYSDEFNQELERLITLTEKDKVPLIFILEPNSTEYRTVVPNHQRMRDVAAEHQIKVIDLHTYMAKKIDSGILWWDFVHATSYGQKLMAEYIYSQMKSELLLK